MHTLGVHAVADHRIVCEEPGGVARDRQPHDEAGLGRTLRRP